MLKTHMQANETHSSCVEKWKSKLCFAREKLLKEKA